MPRALPSHQNRDNFAVIAIRARDAQDIKIKVNRL